jgi:hypothetical protein
MNEKFVVAITACNDTGQPMCHLQIQSLCSTAQALFYLQVLGRVLNQTAFAYVIGLQLKLRL